MPTDDENVKFLWLVLTAGGAPTIDFGPIGAALNLKPGAMSKRWSRLKQAMEAGKPPGPSAHQFLWLCVKNTAQFKTPDWKAIAPLCNTTPGAAAKRLSRLKQAMAAGAAAPGVGGGDADEVTTPKRKRAAGNAGKKTVGTVDGEKESGLGGETSGHNGDVDVPKPAAKRTKAATKPKVAPKPKVNPEPKVASKPKATKALESSKGSTVDDEIFEDAVVAQEVTEDEGPVTCSKVSSGRSWTTAPKMGDYDIFAEYGDYSGSYHMVGKVGEE